MPADFWESLRRGFMQLREECAINPPIAPAGRLTAIWTAQPTRNEWRLYYHDGKDGSGVAKRFAWHAQCAAARLGFVGDEQKAVWFWLDRVRLEAPDSHVFTISVQRPDGIDEVYSHEILDICGLSADYCRKCAADEMIARGVRLNEVMSGQQQRDAESTAASPHQLQGATQGATLRSEFWKERQAEFEKYSKPFHDLKAHWKSAYGNWLLWWGSTPKGCRVPQECMGVFNAITRNAVTAVPVSGVNRDAEPWQLWLDFMRESRWGFEVTGNVACTEREWELGVKDGKPLIQVRREQKYASGDEWKKVYRRTKGGKLRRLSERERRGKSSEDLEQYYHWLQDGTIEHLFETSARFCEDLSSRSFELEAEKERNESADGGDMVAAAVQQKAGGATSSSRGQGRGGEPREAITIAATRTKAVKVPDLVALPAVLLGTGVSSKTRAGAGATARAAGRKPNIDGNRRIAQVVESFRPNWRDRLNDVCEALDREPVPLPKSKKWVERGCALWTDVLDEDREGLVKALQHRLDWVSANPIDGDEQTRG